MFTVQLSGMLPSGLRPHNSATLLPANLPARSCSARSRPAFAMGMPVEQAHGSVRFSLGHGTTAEQIDRTIEALAEVVDKLRQMSPLTPSCGPDGADAS